MSDERPEQLLSERRYPALRTLLATKALPPVDYAFYNGMLANRENRIADSIRLLRSAVPKLQHLGSIGAGGLRAALRALGDDYVKSSQYGAAADVFSELYQQFGRSMTERDRDDTRNTLLTFGILRNIPPQRVSLSAPFVLPMTRDAVDLPTIPVNAGGSDQPWVIDTGANLSTITESTAKRLGMTLSSQTILVGAITGSQVKAHLAAADTVIIGGAILRNVIFLVMRDEDLYVAPKRYQIHAILGFPALAALGRLTFTREGSLRVEPSQGAPNASSNLFLEELTPLAMARVDSDTQDRLFTLDTGARATFFTVRYYQENKKRFLGQSPQEFRMGGAGGITGMKAVIAPSVALDFAGARRVTLKQVHVLAGPLAEPQDSFYGNLGQDVLLQFPAYTLDFRAMQLSFPAA